jgi:hypothetical protein
MENQNEQGKNNNSLIILIAILCLLVLGLGSYIVYDKVLSSNNNQKNTTNTSTNTEIDSALLNNLYDILGINWEGNDGNCLNYFLSNNNYKDINYKSNPNDYSSNAQRIFSLYANHNNMRTYRFNDYNCDEECKLHYSCAECTSILKVDADKIKKIYGLDNLTLNELHGIETDYAYSSGISVGVCHYGVTHDTNSQYIDNDNIRITDKQVVTDYAWPEEEKINSTKNQIVTYDFKKDSNGNYYLNNITVK